MSAPQYFDTATGKEVVFAYVVDAIEQVQLGNVVAKGGSYSEAADSISPEKEQAKDENKNELADKIEPSTDGPTNEELEAGAKRKAPRRRPVAGE